MVDNEHIKKLIILKLTDIIKKLGGMSDLLAPLGSFCDSLDDDEILIMLQEWDYAHRNKRPQIFDYYASREKKLVQDLHEIKQQNTKGG